MTVVDALLHALGASGSMAWQILWPLILGFMISGAIQAVVSHEQMSNLLPDDRPKTLVKASALGAASSSCSYASVALARSLFKKGANFTAAISFQLAATNLVIELGIVMALLLGWRFAVAEYLGAPIMITLLVIFFRIVLRPKVVEAARTQVEKGLSGRMEGHANMHDMSVTGNAGIVRKLLSRKGRTSTSHYFVMDWSSVYTDILLGLLIAGALSAWVPDAFWQSFFFVDHPLAAKLWGPLVGPVVAIFSFVCSVGNVPLAAVLWHGGISFGGVVSFIFADLIIVPILSIYRKYYGTKMAAYIFVGLYGSMVLAGYAVELVFAVTSLTPDARNVHVLDSGISWNYTTFLNFIFVPLAAAAVWRFLRSGGPEMLRSMNSKDG